MPAILKQNQTQQIAGKPFLVVSGLLVILIVSLQTSWFKYAWVEMEYQVFCSILASVNFAGCNGIGLLHV